MYVRCNKTALNHKVNDQIRINRSQKVAYFSVPFVCKQRLSDIYDCSIAQLPKFVAYPCSSPALKTEKDKQY